MSGRRRGLLSVLLGVLLGVIACGGGASSGPPVDPAEIKDAEVLNPRLDDGRVVHLGYDTHHPECFVLAEGTDEGGKQKTEELECPPGEQRLKDCPGGVIYRSKTRPDCICVAIGGEDPRRIDCPP